MTLEEAIEILENYLRGDDPDYAPDLPNAIRLIFKAGKRLQEIRRCPGVSADTLLRGETED